MLLCMLWYLHGQKSQTEQKESYENMARYFTAKYCSKTADLRSFSHKNYFWNTQSTPQILKRYFKALSFQN